MHLDGHPENLIGGRYRLGELLGVGGSASVFAADDTQAFDHTRSSDATEHAGLRVALKLLHPHLCATEESRDAFLREARQAEALVHPNIAAVHAHGLHDTGGVTQAWIALDLIDGESLGERVARLGPLPVAEAAAVLDGVLAGLGAAHAAGLVHRDVSPANVLLVAHDTPLLASHVRLVDFGLADVTGRSVVGSDVLLASQTADAAATEFGVIGNAAFMSPEQAQGKPVRAVSDLYQSGALLYFLLTGRPPYSRNSSAQVLEAHVSAPPPVPSVLAPGARPLDRVVTRAMTKTPVRRFRDADEFRAALVEAALVEAARASTASDSPANEPAVTAPATRVLRTGAATRANTGSESDFGSASDFGQPQRTPATPVGVAVLAVAVLIGGLAVWGALAASAVPEPARETPVAVDTPTPTATQPAQTAAPVASAPPVEAPIATEISVPTLYGSLADAEQALVALGLELGTVSRLDSAEPSERVLGQSPEPAQLVAAGSRVDVTVASGTNTVPAVTSLSLGSATALLESAGFVVKVLGTVSPTAVASATQPTQGAVLRVGVTVILLIDPPPTTPAQPLPHPTEEP